MKLLSKFQKQSLYANILAVSIFLISIISFCASLTLTYSFKLDRFCYKLHDYNQVSSSEDYIPSIMKIRRNTNSNKLFNDLFRSFYYSDYCVAARQYCDDECKAIINSNFYNINLYSQNSLSVADTEAKDGGYRVDYGLFHTYFTNQELDSKSSLGRKFGADSFMYISDYFADIILEQNNLEISSDNYLKLINDPSLCLIDVFIGEDKFSISINNIINSEKRSGPRECQFNSLFGLICFDYISASFSPAFELDIKGYPYYAKKMFKSIKAMNYFSGEYDVSFLTFNNQTDAYIIRDDLSNEFNKISSSIGSITYIDFLPLLVFLIALFVNYLILRRKIGINYCFLFYFELFLLGLLSIVSNFLYIYFLFLSLPVVLIVMLFFMKKEVIINGPFKEYFFESMDRSIYNITI